MKDNLLRKIAFFIICMVIWVLLNMPADHGDSGIDIQVLWVGVVVCIFATIIFAQISPQTPAKLFNPIRYFWMLYYLPMFFYYCILANLDVAYRVLHPKMPIRPGIVKVRTTLKSKSAITALANSITLTPGTLSVDVTDDGFLYIHWINVREEDIEGATRTIVVRFESILRRIFE